MTFLFDIGRVLLDFDFESSLARLLPAGCPDPDARLFQLGERKDEFESGAITAEEFTAWALGVLGSPATPEQFRDVWQNIFIPNEPMWVRVRQLAAAGHRLILFSNTNTLHWEWIVGTYPEFALFHAAVLSYEAGSVKPQPEIYQHAVEVHDLEPAATLYIDDLPQNIATGRAFGFHCHQYDLRDHAAFEQWLAALV